jgi:hypothetical protein
VRRRQADRTVGQEQRVAPAGGQRSRRTLAPSSAVAVGAKSRPVAAEEAAVARAAAIRLARRSGWQITDSVPWALLDSAIAQHDQDRSHIVSIIFFRGKSPNAEYEPEGLQTMLAQAPPI